ncbi:zinc-binding dehydrogenase [Actinocatenispora rupis]|uniref:NADPH:quinone reductase n=1 Tax=Actinocatenispora rupis TaxID=519421 RepID=A0A8J3J4A8_9ACTN|nr:zinc-binding dehydrogenase [Actinocatenispora rupis]GID15536.1 NADPH:quinone reductase [Actinocatenispora rupis]
MLVAEVARFGGPEVLVTRRVPDPAPETGQVVVAVSAVDVLFVETQVRAGWGREHFPVTPPYVPGDGVAGTVVAVGEGVDPAWLGRRVVGYTDSVNAYAERAVVPVEKIVPIPDGVDDATAATLTHDGPMALTLLDTARIASGTRVLVLGANGGAGLLAVGLAAAAGAYVIGAARGAAKQALVREAGAAEVVDPTDADWLDRVRDVDVVLDGVGGAIGSAALAAVRDGGTIFTYGAPTGGFATVDPDEARRRGITVHGLPALAQARDQVTALVARTLAEAAAGRISPVVGGTFPLTDAAGAHAAVEARTVLGKVLLTVAERPATP